MEYDDESTVRSLIDRVALFDISSAEPLVDYGRTVRINSEKEGGEK